ncbi:site-specific integrase, partial [Streptomyces sp. NPDC051554]
MKNGNLIRRCRCTDPETKKEYGASCPKLKSSRRHGTWTAAQELDPAQDGRRRRFRRGGFETSAKAQEELDKVRALMAIPEEDDAWCRRTSDRAPPRTDESAPLLMRFRVGAASLLSS